MENWPQPCSLKTVTWKYDSFPCAQKHFSNYLPFMGEKCFKKKTAQENDH